MKLTVGFALNTGASFVAAWAGANGLPAWSGLIVGAMITAGCFVIAWEAI